MIFLHSFLNQLSKISGYAHSSTATLTFKAIDSQLEANTFNKRRHTLILRNESVNYIADIAYDHIICEQFFWVNRLNSSFCNVFSVDVVQTFLLCRSTKNSYSLGEFMSFCLLRCRFIGNTHYVHIWKK